MDDEKPARGDTEYLSTLERGLSVLRAFNGEHPEMTLSEVAAATSLSPAAARRCLNTLVELGYVAKHRRMFLLRPEVLSFASAYLDSMGLEDVARPHLQAVRDETGDSVSLAVLSGPDILYLVHVSTNRMVRLATSVGARFPAYATSLGRALLAHQGDAFLDEYLKTADLQKLTEHTITDPRVLRKTLMEVRAQHYAAVEDELDYGIVSVAVPIFAEQGFAAAAINCSTSTSRMRKDALIQSRLPILVSAAKHIQSSLRRIPFLLHSIHPS
jgi:IclR family pca regulon transcriptional regulator